MAHGYEYQRARENMFKHAIRLTGALILLLGATTSNAQNRLDLCDTITHENSNTESICRSYVEFSEDNYQRELRQISSRVRDPQLFIEESSRSLDNSLSHCRDTECFTAMYHEETMRLQDLGARMDDSARSAMKATVQSEDPGIHYPDAMPMQAYAEEQAADDQQTESHMATAQAPAAVPPPVIPEDAKATGQASANTGGKSSETAHANSRSNSTAEKKSVFVQLGVLFLWGVFGCIALLLFLGATNQVVIFYDREDVFISFIPALSMIIGMMIATSLAHPDGSYSILGKIIIGIAGIIALAAAYVTYCNSILHNRSTFLGLAIGTLKLGAATFTTVSVIGQLRKLTDGKSTSQQKIGALIILALMGLLWRILVNGQRVYQKRGWQPIAAT